MSTENKYEAWTVVAQDALTNLTAATGHLHKAVRNKTGSFASNGREAVGLLKTGADSGGNLGVGYFGIMKYAAATAITSADTLLSITTSGYGKIADSGDWIVGRTITAATSGMVAKGMFNFVSPSYLGE
jgi:hypothetical protein